MSRSSPDMTLLLNHAFTGNDKAARAQVFEHLYGELRKAADQFMKGERDGHSWRPSDLLNECVAKLLEDPPAAIPNREYFFGAARNVMWRLLNEHDRQRKTVKRGGAFRRTFLDETLDALDKHSTDLPELNITLEELKHLDRCQFDVFTAVCFCGLTLPQAAALLGLPGSTAKKKFNLARAFLIEQLRSGK